MCVHAHARISIREFIYSQLSSKRAYRFAVLGSLNAATSCCGMLPPWVAPPPPCPIFCVLPTTACPAERAVDEEKKSNTIYGHSSRSQTHRGNAQMEDKPVIRNTADKTCPIIPPCAISCKNDAMFVRFVCCM